MNPAQAGSLETSRSLVGDVVPTLEKLGGSVSQTPTRVSPGILSGLLRVADALVLLAAGWGAHVLLVLAGDATRSGRETAVACVIAAYVCVAVLGRAGGYGLARLRRLRRQVGPLGIALIAAACAYGAFAVLLHGSMLQAREAAAWVIASSVLLVPFRAAVASQVQRGIASGRLACKTAVVGANTAALRFVEQVAADTETAISIVGVYEDRMAQDHAAIAGLAVAGGLFDLLEESRRHSIDVIAIALPLEEADRIGAIAAQLGSAVADIYCLVELDGRLMSPPATFPTSGQLALSIVERPLKDWRGLQKAVFDYVLGLLLLALLGPVMLLIAIAVRLDSRGPVLFRQPRLGFNNNLFTVYKFRTMRSEMTDMLADRQTIRDDPRITRVGAVLRKLSLDELPQLFNVLRGEMSLVGPRPHAPHTKAAGRLFPDVVAQYASRHRVKPGITGWAQVNGWRGETRTVAQLEARVAHDIHYIANWSMMFDIRILALTLVREIRSKNAF